MAEKWDFVLRLTIEKQKSRSMLTNVGICDCDWQVYIFNL